jgi:hypothetical protein
MNLGDLILAGDVTPFPVPQIMQDGTGIAPDVQMPKSFYKTYRGPLYDLQNLNAPFFASPPYPENDAMVDAIRSRIG